MIILIIFIRLIQSKNQCFTNEQSYNGKCISNECLDMYLFKLEQMQINQTFEYFVFVDPSNRIIDVNMLIDSELSVEQCLQLRIMKYPSNEFEQQQGQELSMDVQQIPQLESNQRILKFIINQQQYDLINHYCYEFHIYDIISYFYCLSFNITSDRNQSYFVNFQQKQFNQTSICNYQGKCIKNITTSLKFCLNDNCTETSTNKQSFDLTQNLIIIHSIEEEGFEYMSIIPQSLFFQEINEQQRYFKNIQLSNGQSIIESILSIDPQNYTIFLESQLQDQQSKNYFKHLKVTSPPLQMEFKSLIKEIQINPSLNKTTFNCFLDSTLQFISSILIVYHLIF